MKKPVDLAHACRLINHGPTVLVASAHGGRRNLMTAAWSMPVEFVPPRVAVVIDKRTHTRELMMASGAFTLSVPCHAVLDLTYTVGSVTGHGIAPHEPDKFIRYGIEAFDAPLTGQPFVEGCVAWLECRLIREPHTEEAYDTCFAEVVSAQADARVFDGGRWSFRDDNTALHTLHHLGGGNFALPSRVVQGTVLGVRG